MRDREPGAFVVRDSQSYEHAFGLAVKVETPPIGVLKEVGGDICKFFLFELERKFLLLYGYCLHCSKVIIAYYVFLLLY